jgi:hypothetical protein
VRLSSEWVKPRLGQTKIGSNQRLVQNQDTKHTGVKERLVQNQDTKHSGVKERLVQNQDTKHSGVKERLVQNQDLSVAICLLLFQLVSTIRIRILNTQE